MRVLLWTKWAGNRNKRGQVTESWAKKGKDFFWGGRDGLVLSVAPRKGSESNQKKWKVKRGRRLYYRRGGSEGKGLFGDVGFSLRGSCVWRIRIRGHYVAMSLARKTQTHFFLSRHSTPPHLAAATALSSLLRTALLLACCSPSTTLVTSSHIRQHHGRCSL